jgi:DNA repair protein RecN (Recombination protein N)
MLQNLHVKNLALIEETEVTFGEGINILTGETGAGKSLLIGSINLALGAKFEKDMLRRDADSALVELTFFDGSQKVKDKLEEMDLEADEDGMVIITRKLQKGKSICKINGETVTAKNVKELAEVLLDIHGQHEHQSLLLKKKHLEILDAFCGESYLRISAEVADAYHAHAKLQQALKEASMDESARERERSLAEFELQEIEQAAIVPGEDEKLEQRYRFMVNGKKIVEGLTESYGYTGSDYENGAANALGRALRALHTVSGYDERLETLAEQLTEIEYLLADYNRDISSYMEDCEFDPQDFQVVEERLNVLNRLKDKYGRTLDDVIAYAKESEAYLERLTNYDLYMENLTREVAAAAAK